LTNILSIKQTQLTFDDIEMFETIFGFLWNGEPCKINIQCFELLGICIV